MCNRLSYLVLLLTFCFHFPFVYAESNQEQLFAGSDRETVMNVELFEFNSPEQQAQAIALAKTLRCPQCQNQNLIESNSPIAMDLRLEVFTLLREGKTEQEIIGIMTHRFGDFVLYDPPFSLNTYLLWLSPLLLAIVFILWAVKKVKRQQK